MIRQLLATGLALGWLVAPSPSGANDDAYDPAKQLLIGTEAPAIELSTSDGGAFSLRDLRGEIVVIHFGASW